MIDYNLRKQIEQALLEGRQEDALRLSQELDIQILQATKAMVKTTDSTLSSTNKERSQS